jgi:hypothetical protein
MRQRTVAVLRRVSRSDRPPRTSALSAMRGASAARGALVSSLPAGAAARREGAVPVRRSGASRRPPAEVRRLATGRRGARRGDGAGVRPRRRRDHVGSAFMGEEGDTRIRPGERPRPRRGTEDRARRRAAAWPRGRGRTAGSTSRRRAPERDGRFVRRSLRSAVTRRARRRRVDDGRHRRRVCRRARARRRLRGLRAHRGAGDIGPRLRTAGWRDDVCEVHRTGSPPILGPGLASGSVVDRGTSLRKSKPAAGEATHVSRPLVGEHGAV